MRLLILIASLIILTSFASSPDPLVCASVYGKPDPARCFDVLSFFAATDKRVHFFSPPQLISPPRHIPRQAWRNRIDVPLFRTYCKLFVHDCFKTNKAKANFMIAGQCTVGVFPIKRADGTISGDSASYPSLAADAEQIREHCLLSTPRHIFGHGGHVDTGTYALEISHGSNMSKSLTREEVITTISPLFCISPGRTGIWRSRRESPREKRFFLRKKYQLAQLLHFSDYALSIIRLQALE